MKQLSMDELNRPAPEQYRAAEKMPVVVVLDNIRSGLNVGAIFRTPPHAEILKTALGSTDSVKWMYAENTIDILNELLVSGYTILPVEQTDESVFLDDAKLTTDFPLALVFGNEMRGISAEILALCSKSLEVPQSGIKHSLNVATTAGIVLWECYRQFRLRRFLSPES
jgi:23S rRNA (guanosine2251-2'-O)-methyltransferase